MPKENDYKNNNDVKVIENAQSVDNNVVEEGWNPKTELGRKVKAGEITAITQILDSGDRILEPEIVDYLVPDLKVDFISIGQAKGKFGGGKRTIFKKVQKKTAEGNKQRFVALAIVGNGKGLVGFAMAKSRENVPAREKAVRLAKLNLIHISFGCGSWECNCNGNHSIPFAIEGRSGSARIRLEPAPKGTGLVVDNEVIKVLKLAGYKDVRGKVRGQSKNKQNVIKAVFDALKKLSQVKMHQTYVTKVKTL